MCLGHMLHAALGYRAPKQGNCLILIWEHKMMFTMMMQMRMHILDMHTCTCTCNAQLFIIHTRTHSHMHIRILDKHVGLHALLVDVHNDDALQKV